MKYDPEFVKEWAGESQWRSWRADWAHYNSVGVNPLDRGGFWALTVYRLQRATRTIRPKIIALPLRVFLSLLRRVAIALTRVDLCQAAEIGPGLLMVHGGPIVVGMANIGANCSIFQMTTIGAGPIAGTPWIGDNVFVGCHSCILGGVTVGDGAKIGAGTIIVKDVPPGATAIGATTRILNKCKDN